MKFINAIRAFLFGSYSIDFTMADILYLFLLKSTTLYCFLWPPPRCLIVITPRLLRPLLR